MKLNATEVRRRIFSLLGELPEEGIVITRNGVLVARLVPIERPKKGPYVTEPILIGNSKPGPLFPKDENAYHLLFD